jgi:hypothetical protein
MMRIALIILLGLILSCSTKHENKLKLVYNNLGNADYSPGKEHDKRFGVAVLVFSNNFDLDTINVKYNGIDSTVVISTDEVTGFADELRLGKIDGSKDIELTINKYDPVKFNVNQEDQLFLIELIDSTLKVNSVYIFPGFR